MPVPFIEFAYRQRGGVSQLSHRHQNDGNYEIIQVLSGNGTAFFHDHSYPLEPGMLFFIDATSLHSINPSNDDIYCRNKLIVSQVMLKGILGAMNISGLLEALFNSPAGVCLRLNETQFRQMDASFLAMAQELSLPDAPSRALRLTSLLLDMLSHVSLFSVPASPCADDHLTHVIDYLRLHLADPISIDELADQMHLNKYYLCHMFRARTGFTLLQYVYEQRLNAACEQLSLTDQPISAIAENCGFRTSSHFCAMFKRREGMSPRDYRRSAQKTNAAPAKSP